MTPEPPRSPRVPPPRPATSLAASAASPCWTAPTPWPRAIPSLPPHRTHRAPSVDPCDPMSRASTVRIMHSVDPTTESMIRSVLAYAENRLRLDPVPLDRGSRDPAELEAALNGLLGPEPHNPDQVLGVYTSVIAPAVISADSPRFLGFIPAAPTKASLLFDMLISCASIQGISWLEAAGAIHAENQVLRILADRAGLPASAGGCFVSGGSAANLSALAVAREMAKRRVSAGTPGRAGQSRQAQRWRAVVGSDAHSSIHNTLQLLEMDALVVPTRDHRLTGQAARAAIEADGDPASLALIAATAGTTNAGIIDDLAGVAGIAREHDLW